MTANRWKNDLVKNVVIEFGKHLLTYISFIKIVKINFKRKMWYFKDVLGLKINFFREKILFYVFYNVIVSLVTFFKILIFFYKSLV